MLLLFTDEIKFYNTTFTTPTQKRNCSKAEFSVDLRFKPSVYAFQKQFCQTDFLCKGKFLFLQNVWVELEYRAHIEHN
jgi:hypothetical protein